MSNLTKYIYLCLYLCSKDFMVKVELIDHMDNLFFSLTDQEQARANNLLGQILVRR